MKRRWPNVSLVQLWCMFWAVNEQVRRLQQVKTTVVIVPGRPEDFGR